MTSATGRGSLLNAVTSKHAASKGKPKIEKLKDPAEMVSIALANSDKEFNSPDLVHVLGE